MDAPSSSGELAAGLQAVFGLLPGAYLLLSPQLRVELVSAGYQAAEVAGWPHLPVGSYAPAVLDAAPAGQCLAARLRTSLTQVLLTGRPHEAACRSCQLADPDLPGSPPAWQLVSQPVYGAAGAASHVLCSIRLKPAAPVPPNLAPLALLAQLPVALCLLLVEELHVRTDVQTVHAPQVVELRREEITFERLPGTVPPATP